MEKIKILVVDDKKIIGDMFDFILGYSGHEIKIVQSAEVAVELVKSEPFDIAFLDIVMPGKDGVSLLEEIKTIAPKLPVVMMSGYSVDQKRQRVKDLGAVACLEKPFEMDDVRRIVKETIGKEI